MHTDENKRFDKRNIERNIKEGIITRKDYEIHLSKLSDARDKVFNPEEYLDDLDEFELGREDEAQAKKRAHRKKTKGKGK